MSALWTALDSNQQAAYILMIAALLPFAAWGAIDLAVRVISRRETRAVADYDMHEAEDAAWEALLAAVMAEELAQDIAAWERGEKSW